MIISHDLKLIFIHVHRTGGTSIMNTLKACSPNSLEVISQHGNAKSKEKQFLDDFKDYYKFGFVRNPWDRILSWYLLLNAGNKYSQEELKTNFEHFLKVEIIPMYEHDPYFHTNQFDYFTDDNDNLLVDKIGRYENYDDDLRTILREAGQTTKVIPTLNATQQCIIDRSVLFTDKSRQLIKEICKKDIEYFGYHFYRSRTYETA